MVARRLIFLAVLGSFALFVASAQATFPGGNGRIVYVAAGNLVTMNPDGTGQVPLTSSGDADHPVWSPDGTKIAFDRTIAGNTDIWVINEDGSGPVQLTTNPAADNAPAWSPDGARIAFASTRDGNAEIYSMNADGADQVRLTNNSVADNFPDWAPDGSVILVEFGRTMKPDGSDQQTIPIGRRPSWYPDSTRLAYIALTQCPSFCLHYDHVFKANRDGSNAGDISHSPNYNISYDGPVWSPDGSQIVAQRRPCATLNGPPCSADWRIMVMSFNGTNQVEIADGYSPDWQRTFPTPYVRPKGATPFATYFVPAYKTCTSPNRTHGAPLAFASCTPPIQTSLNVTSGTPDANAAGAKFIGSAKLSVVLGNPTTTTDEADVKVSVSLTDIRCTDTTAACTAGALSDYTGSMRLKLSVDLADTYVPNLPAMSKGVVSIPIPCATTADASIGSACSTATTVDSVIPGAVREGNRAIWGLDRMEIWDGGQDGLLATSDDDTLFAVQGVFVP
jgi:hypothetical protein